MSLKPGDQLLLPCEVIEVDYFGDVIKVEYSPGERDWLNITSKEQCKVPNISELVQERGIGVTKYKESYSIQPNKGFPMNYVHESEVENFLIALLYIRGQHEQN